MLIPAAKQMDNLGGFSEDEKKLQEEFDDFYMDVHDDIKKCAKHYVMQHSRMHAPSIAYFSIVWTP